MTETVGLSPFTTYINAVGAEKIRVATEQRERRENPESMAWWCYQAAYSGLRDAISSPTPDRVLDHMVEQAPTKMAGHYREIADGIHALLARSALTLVPVGPASWEAEGLAVNLSNCLGVRRRDGSTLVLFPYFKAGGLTTSTAPGIVRLVELGTPKMLPGATPAVLEVRTGKLRRPHPRRNLARLDEWLHVEARAYLHHITRRGTGDAA